MTIGNDACFAKYVSVDFPKHIRRRRPSGMDILILIYVNLC